MLNIKIEWDAITKIGDELAKINETLISINKTLTPPEAFVIRFYIEEDGILKRVRKMDLKVTDTKKAVLKIVDAKGNPAQVDGVPVWSSLDPTLFALEVSADGMSALIKPVGPVGLSKIQVSADADLGEGQRAIAGEADVNLLPGDAVSLELAFEDVAPEVAPA